MFIFFEFAFYDKLAMMFVHLFLGISIPHITAITLETPLLTV